MIRLIVLGHSSDDKGTQLETLTASILSSLKYTDIIMNVVGKGGNELDVVAKYSTPHISGDLIHPVVCECKAYKSKVDITDWLKFLGKFYTARLEDSKAMGIMIALSGANGNVVGAYDGILKKNVPISLVSGDDLLKSLASVFKMPPYDIIRKKVSYYTDDHIHSCDLLYYDSEIYWSIKFKDRYTILSSQGDCLEVGSEIDLVSMNGFKLPYVNLAEETFTRQKRLLINKLIIYKLLNDESGNSKNELMEYCARMGYAIVDENEFDSLLLENPFVANNGSQYEFHHSTPIAFYQYYLQLVYPMDIIKTRYYQENIDSDLIKEIERVQGGIQIPKESYENCLLMLRYSPNSLSYAVIADEAITRNRQDGKAIFPEIEAIHTSWFLRKVTSSFNQDSSNVDLIQILYNEFGIQGVNLSSNISIQTQTGQKDIKLDVPLEYAPLSIGENTKIVPLVPIKAKNTK